MGYFLVGAVALLVGGAIGLIVERAMKGGAYKTRDDIVEQAKRDAENIAKTAELAAKEEGFRRREAVEKELNQARDGLRNQERQLDKRESGIKRILLDQTAVSGVGNIYADEALWRAKLHGDRLGTRLRRGQVEAVLGGVRAVMGAALLEGGTSFDALYVNVNGQSGYFDRSLQVYGREGEPCARCGTPIRRVSFMNRSSYFCPSCQPRPRARRSTT